MSCADIMLYINAILYILKKRIPLLHATQPLSLSVCRLYLLLTFSYPAVWYCVLGQSCPPFVCFSCGVFNSQEGEGADPAVRYNMLYHAMLCCSILCCTIQYYVILYYTMFCYTILYYIVLYYTVLYYAISLYAVLCCAVLYCLALIFCVLIFQVLHCSTLLSCIALCLVLLYFFPLYSALQYYSLTCSTFLALLLFPCSHSLSFLTSSRCTLPLSADVSEGERKYLGDQVRTLQIKCDLLKKQNEQQRQQHLEAREEDERRTREREEDDSLNKVS